MQFGVKTFSSGEFLRYFEKKSDFFEIMALQGNDYSFLKNFSIPIIIHAEHQGFGINPADSTKKEQNLKSINFAINLANVTGAKKIIVHPGVIEKGNKNCSMKNSINFFKEVNDDRILLENLFKDEYGALRGKGLCGTPRKTKRLLKKTGLRFCFDVNHALAGMKNFKGRYNFIKQYLKLNPFHYHIGGQRITPFKQHTYLNDSDLDLKKILNYYPKNAEITLETGIEEKFVEEDLNTIRRIVEEIEKE